MYHGPILDIRNSSFFFSILHLYRLRRRRYEHLDIQTTAPGDRLQAAATIILVDEAAGLIELDGGAPLNVAHDHDSAP